MIFKRYVPPALLAIASYGLLYWMLTPVDGFFVIGLIITVAAAYFIRLCDDLCDYQHDLENGKAAVPKTMLIIMTSVTALILITIPMVFSLFWLLMIPTVIPLQFLIRDRFRDWIKPLFLPTILTALCLSVFHYTPALWFLNVGMIMLDIIILLWKKVHT